MDYMGIILGQSLTLNTPLVTCFVPVAPVGDDALSVIENVPDAIVDVSDVTVTVPLAPDSSVSQIVDVVTLA